MNLNKLFPWLSIRYKLIIAFAGLSVLPVVLVSVWSILSNVRALKQVAYENLTHDVHIIRDNTANFLTRVEGDMRILHQFTLFRDLMERRAFPPAAVKIANEEALSFMQSRGIYDQLRLIDADEDEVLRIECDNPLDSVRHYHLVPHEALRRGSEKYYELLTGGLHSGDVVLMPAEILSQHGQRIPVISVAMPIDMRRAGRFILVANVFAKDFFAVVESDRHLDVKGKVIIVTHDGHYLYHSEKKTDWNRLLAAREEDNLQHDYPAAVASAVLSGKEGITTGMEGEIVSYAPLLRSGDSRFNVEPAFTTPFFVVESVPTDLILGPARSFAETFLVFLGAFLIAAVGLGLLATRQFTRPIAELEKGAAVISRGNYSHRLSVETHDEIERLAGQFNLMAASLEEREREIRQHRETLEETVRARTKELTEEKTKLQAILDNIPSAFILLDGNFKIQTTSAAFSSVMGFPAEDVLNRDCETLLCGSGFCQHCVAREAAASGAIESHVDVVSGRPDGDRFFEHIAIPMRTNGETGSIIEIITDITKRKQFEQRLIQAERLTAAGEMSAIIAHEFRNSLTSIKMILQLQRESKRLSRSDGKSLDVALHSIYHMERVVTELLNFARPAPLQFRRVGIASVINECIAFVELQMAKSHVALRKTIDSSLPALRLDPSRFKEALINILLNAVQAIDAKAERAEYEHIDLSVEQRVLRRSVRQLVGVEGSEENGKNEVSEVNLRQGTRCIVIEVKDTGAGIEPENMKRIFDPFFTTKVNGTGLGLPLVKRTVNAHGGVVGIRSENGGGATLAITMPLSEEL